MSKKTTATKQSDARTKSDGYSELFNHLAGGKWRRKPNATKANNLPAKKLIAESDNRIATAKEILLATARGEQAFKDLQEFLNSNQQGLDKQGGEAVIALVEEFFRNSRRFF